MRSTFMGIETAKRSLFAQQTALQTTAHNISNANTEGYTRQSVNLVASRPLEAVGLMRSNTPGQIGTGVEFDYINRIREKFLDDQYMNENKSYGEWNIRSDTMEKLEGIINEPSDTGIRQVIEGFWNAWQELSKQPENLTARVLVKERALTLTDAFNHTSKQLKDLSDDLTNNVNIKVNQSNSILGQVAGLNNEIVRIEGLGDNANDLRDQRDLLIDQLSKIMNVSVTENSSGYIVKMGNVELINGKNVTTTFSENATDSNSFDSYFASGELQSGETYGMILSRDKYVSDYRFQFDSMVKSLVQGDVKVTLPKGMVIPNGTVIDGVTYTGTITSRTLTSDIDVTVKGINGLHQLGYAVRDPIQSGIPFFSIKPGATDFTAESISVNPNIVKDVSYIASSNRTYDDAGTEKVVKGNNEMALLIAGLSNKKFNFEPSSSGKSILTDGTFSEFYQSIVGELGVQGQEASRQADNHKILIDQVASSRESVSGVSLDEEMANMMKFQHAYNAAARTMTTFDEMLDKVINSMGIVGR